MSLSSSLSWPDLPHHAWSRRSSAGCTPADRTSKRAPSVEHISCGAQSTTQPRRHSHTTRTRSASLRVVMKHSCQVRSCLICCCSHHNSQSCPASSVSMTASARRRIRNPSLTAPAPGPNQTSTSTTTSSSSPRRRLVWRET